MREKLKLINLMVNRTGGEGGRGERGRERGREVEGREGGSPSLAPALPTSSLGPIRV